MHNQAMEPLTVSSSGTISVMEQYTLDPKAIYSLFYIQRQVHAEAVTFKLDDEET